MPQEKNSGKKQKSTDTNYLRWFFIIVLILLVLLLIFLDHLYREGQL